MIIVDHISKRFGEIPALCDISFQVAAGESLALVGGSGSGKTTLIKCLVGLMAPTTGTITIHGLDRRRDSMRLKGICAYLGARTMLYSHFTPRRYLSMVADIYAVEEPERETRMAQLFELFDLAAVADRRLSSCSIDQHRKTAICASLICGVDYYFLDEPLSGGLDPPGARALAAIIRQFAHDNQKTLILATADVESAAKLCRRMALLWQGKLVATLTGDDLQNRAGAGETLEMAVGRIIQQYAAADFGSAN